MTQVELPQLSLQRYVDLVRRRRWQLVPVSLAGLLVGGMVAFFIPRFFVASTLLVHEQTEQQPTDAEHPFRVIVDTAKSTIPLAIGEALDVLKWPEAQLSDRYERAQYERQVESRLKVDDSNAWELKRTYAQLTVTYRDLDGERARAFLNTLVDVWIKKRLKEIRDPAEALRQSARDAAERWARTVDGYYDEKVKIQQDYGIRPEFSLDAQRDQYAKLADRQAEQQQKLLAMQGELAKVDRQIETDRARLAAIDKRVPFDSSTLFAQAAALPEAKPLLVQWLGLKLGQANLLPGTRAWRAKQVWIDSYEQRLQALVPKGDADADGMVPNPLYVQLEAGLAATEAHRAELAKNLEMATAAVAAEATRIKDLEIGYKEYEKKLRQIQDAEEQKKAAQLELTKAETRLRTLGSQVPVRQTKPALVPPRPTDPNILVVAVIGCVLGLGMAIGLILLLDIAQGTFKTIEDVERGLAVPVLGGVSHLETEEERKTAVRGRRRASLAAAAVLALVTIVVTIFYVDPTRLPPVVRDLLAMLLGS